MYGNLLVNLASVLSGGGEDAAADTAIRAAIEVLRTSVGPAHPDFVSAHGMYAALRAGVNDWPATERAARVVVDAIGGPLHESEGSAAVALQQLGLALAARGANAAADSALRRSLELRQKYLPRDHWAIASSEAVLGYHLALTGREVRGEPMLRGAYEALKEARGADAEITRLTAQRMAEVMEKLKRPTDAARWRALGAAAVG